MNWYRLGWILLCVIAWAQPPRPRERIRSLHIAYLAQEMELLPEEAQHFWPVYNARDAELQKNRSTLRAQLHRIREQRPQLPPEAYRDSISAIYLTLWQREAEIRKAYHEQFKKVLPPEKLARFYLAEMRLLRRALGEGELHERD
ncbi:MAG: hypothetical protein N3A68_03260 [Bacteroidia bacterium]|nr:hypothetical protein [Bacteroidia bacterium]GIV24051.1 MAG: hypothetical protein KatS3mg025_1710 [Bacteroidia bacterium]